MKLRLVPLIALALLAAPLPLVAEPASATTCVVLEDPVRGAVCVVRAEVCLFTDAIRDGWCPI